MPASIAQNAILIHQFANPIDEFARFAGFLLAGLLGIMLPTRGIRSRAPTGDIP
ncbi:hypothetical protein [Trinickia violacea]|uniref:hypothetical protein n=1 Tax=Trinickia violacea TaxID=2571746 RepID=UPI001586F8B5|nr:hypothetical protein [Trinickia violacea]